MTIAGLLALTILIIAVTLAAWDVWTSTRPTDDEIWFTEEDPRRTPNWRRI